MTITEIYDHYKINKGLREHMLRVAAVAKQAAEQYQASVDTNSLIDACLLHDMGNILKFNFDLNSEHFEPEGVAYWKAVKEEFQRNYGADVHIATHTIVSEINPTNPVNNIIQAAQFEKIVSVASIGSTEAKFLEYADMRVGLLGITTLDERFKDIQTRYPDRFTKKQFQAFYQAAKQIEIEIFSQSKIRPEDITDASTAQLQTELLDWEVETTLPKL